MLTDPAAAVAFPNIRVEMRRPCRFSRREWLTWLNAMMAAAADAAMLWILMSTEPEYSRRAV